MKKTEFFETAVQQGFYGQEKSGLYGKKDNVRKYWEDISIKSSLRTKILNLINKKQNLRIVDLGSGCGEGFELISHIPSANKTSTHKDFILDKENIELYLGLDISTAMVELGNEIYKENKNIVFRTADLSKDLSFFDYGPFDIYLSTYSSPSHLTESELTILVSKILEYSEKDTFIVLDLFARYSPEWPCYWNKSESELLPYNMSWLFLPNKPDANKVENYYVTFWSASNLENIINSIASDKKRSVKIEFVDRSIFVGRHIDTGIYNNFPQPIRYQVNRLFDRDFRGEPDKLKIDLSFIKEMENQNHEVMKRIYSYAEDWNNTIKYLEALWHQDNSLIKEMIETSREELSEEFKMLVWLERNSSRFPVVDFWASIMGPQIACVLRNLELNLPNGVGCGHGLVCLLEIES